MSNKDRSDRLLARSWAPATAAKIARARSTEAFGAHTFAAISRSLSHARPGPARAGAARQRWERVGRGLFKITHVEIVPEIATEPNYGTALTALKAASGA